MTSFAELGLSPALLKSLSDVGYVEPSPIQEEAIPALLQGRDVIGQAQTGTGKTAAFGLPLIEHIDPTEPSVQGLVLTPTRELCIQVTQALRTYGRHRKVDVVAVFGGAPIRSQQAQLKEGGQIVVGTVGRILDLISRHSLYLHDCRFVVLDEADEMLDLGFLEDVEKILSATPNGRQTALFSATMPAEIRALASRHLYDPITVKVKSATLTIDTVEQFFLTTPPREKVPELIRVLREEKPEQAIVFVRTKMRCDSLQRDLDKQGLTVRALHGDMSQGSRDGVMLAFKAGRNPLLVATDVAARGLDISSVTHVINFDIPSSPDVYVHRIGRTGRSGRSGRAITLVEPKQEKLLTAIEEHTQTKVSSWVEGAHVARVPIHEIPRRHRKPHDSAVSPDDAKRSKVIVTGGSLHGLNEADLIAAIRAKTSLGGEAIRDIHVLERFTIFTVPASEQSEVLAAIDSAKVNGVVLLAQALPS